MMSINLPTSPRRILIIKPSALGDIVHTLPVLNLLRRRWPDAHISWLIGSAFAGLVQGHPQLNEVITFDRNRFARAWYKPPALIDFVRFVRDLKRRKFDLVIDLQGLFRSGWFTSMTGAAVRVGFANARELAHFFYTHHVPIHSMEQHAIDRYLAITDALGCGREPVEFNLSIDAADHARVDELLGGATRFALILPGTNWPTKRWPAERFAELIAPLRGEFGLTSVIAGGPDVSEIAEVIFRSRPDLEARVSPDSYAAPGVNAGLGSDAANGVLNLVGQTSLRELVALIDRATVVVANDSGPMHIAAAMNKPLVTIFGPTNPTRTGPYRRDDSVVRVDIPCSPCYSRKCSHISCMKWLAVDAVLAQIRRQLASNCHHTL